MCGRYVFRWEAHALEWERMKTVIGEQYPDAVIPEGDIFPGYKMPVLIKGDDKAKVRLMTWGYKGFSGGKNIINARAETAEEKQLFRQDIALRRCAVPANGFYEWTHDDKKIKYYFSVDGSEMIFFAGMYNKDGEYVIITTDANQYMEDVHTRMPLIIERKELLLWLNDDRYTQYFLKKRDTVLSRTASEGR